MLRPSHRPAHQGVPTSNDFPPRFGPCRFQCQRGPRPRASWAPGLTRTFPRTGPLRHLHSLQLLLKKYHLFRVITTGSALGSCPGRGGQEKHTQGPGGRDLPRSRRVATHERGWGNTSRPSHPCLVLRVTQKGHRAWGQAQTQFPAHSACPTPPSCQAPRKPHTALSKASSVVRREARHAPPLPWTGIYTA